MAAAATTAAGSAMMAGKLGMAVASELPPETLARNAHEYGGAAEWNNSQEFGGVRLWGWACLYFSRHLDNELLEIIICQTLWRCCK